MPNLTDSNGQPVICTCPDCKTNYIRMPSFDRCEVCGKWPLKQGA